MTPWAPERSVQIEEVEKDFFSRVFGVIGRNRTKKVTFALSNRRSRRPAKKFWVLKMLKRSRHRKKLILAQARELRNFDELQWTSRDLEAMFRQEQFQEPFEYIQNGVSAKKLREKLVIDRGEISEQQRKRKIPYDKPQ